MRKVVFLLWIVVFSAAVFGQEISEGSLFAVGKTGKELGACPLKSTSVKTDISGFLARVRVRQEFENSFTEPIEAVYSFPLSQNGAVDDMTMTVGERVIKGKIMRREEARQVYETAKSEGKTASLLDQERPNIFTQAVANIMPGERVIVEISYVETLKYEDGAYEFVFPMVVGPRYIPGGVKDAAKIKPPVAETRSGHDISIDVNLNAGVPVEEIRSLSHTIKPSKPKKAGPLTPAQIREARLKEKLFWWIFDLVSRLKKGDRTATANEAKFVRDGKAEIQIELTVRSADVIQKLKAAWFEVVSEKGRTIILGRIAIEKLAALAEIAEVKLILPKL